ncbi:MAG: hypothetical protein SGJ11_02125 [Phycisphaerae bacterium]|nr:hypothetical protein [Phycisphaerae bacterium]
MTPLPKRPLTDAAPLPNGVPAQQRSAKDVSTTGLPAAFQWALDAAADPGRAAADWIAREIAPTAPNAAVAIAASGTTLEQLIALKVAFKALRSGAAIASERNRAARLYAASIAAGLVRFDIRISRQSDVALRRAFTSLRDDDSSEESLRELAIVAISRL